MGTKFRNLNVNFNYFSFQSFFYYCCHCFFNLSFNMTQKTMRNKRKLEFKSILGLGVNNYCKFNK